MKNSTMPLWGRQCQISSFRKESFRGGADYLPAHREKLMLQRDLEEIRSGKVLGDGYVCTLEAFRGD